MTGHGRRLADLPRSGSWLVTLYGIVEAAHLLSDWETADEAYRLLRPFAHLPIAAGPAVSCFGSVEHALGLAQLTLGEHERAAEHLQRAVRHNTAMGHLPAAALARQRLAAALKQHGGGQGPAAPVCRRQGRVWRIQAAGRIVEVEHCRGMAYLAVLLANPGQEISAVRLATVPRAAARTGDIGIGLTGWVRTLPSAEEQARTAVGKAIRRALQRIADADPELGRLLTAGVRTGKQCSYAQGNAADAYVPCGAGVGR
jgi:hypothetical protein